MSDNNNNNNGNNALIINEEQLSNVMESVVARVIASVLDDKLLSIDNKVSITNNSLNDYIEIANDINSEVSIFKHRDKMEWGLYVYRALRDIGLKSYYESVRTDAREFVKNIVLPTGTWESVVLTDMFNASKFKREIHEACNLCKQSHPEWFD